MLLPYTRKVVSPSEAQRALQAHRHNGQEIVFTNGCFDVLHRGHLSLLIWAKRQGDILVAGLNSDTSVRLLKGANRPINTRDDRACLLAGFECVDYVTIFDEKTPANIIEMLQPDVLVKGGDYQDVKRIVGYKTVTSRGGQVLIAPYQKGYSSTNSLQKWNL